MSNKQFKIGYTQGTYDLFHIGHLNLLEHAKELCDFLIVGINSDELVKSYKNKNVHICAKDRARIVKALKVVDDVIITNTLDKIELYKKLNYDVIFIGNDWEGSQRWSETEKELSKFGVPVKYLPHTNGISTTIISQQLNKKN